MAVTLKGGPVKIGGQFLSKGQKAPDFSLADKTRADVNLASFAGKRKGMSTKDEQEILTLEHYLEFLRGKLAIELYILIYAPRQGRLQGPPFDTTHGE